MLWFYKYYCYHYDKQKFKKTPQELVLISWVISHWWIVFVNVMDLSFLCAILDTNNVFKIRVSITYEI